MPFDINEFRGSFGDSEPFKASAYEVQFASLPSGLLPELTDTDTRYLNYRCLSASLPSKSLGTTDLKTYGPIRKMAYGGIHDNISLTFILSDNMKERELFVRWIDFISPDRTGNAKYYKDYVKDFSVFTFNKNGKINYITDFLEAYPVSIGPVELGWDQENSVSTVEVTFAYRYFEESLFENEVVEDFSDIINRTSDIIDDLN